MIYMGTEQVNVQSGELNIDNITMEFNTVSGDRMKALDHVSDRKSVV